MIDASGREAIYYTLLFLIGFEGIFSFVELGTQETELFLTKLGRKMTSRDVSFVVWVCHCVIFMAAYLDAQSWDAWKLVSFAIAYFALNLYDGIKMWLDAYRKGELIPPDSFF